MASTKKVRGLLVEIGGDTTKLQMALKDVDKKTSSLSKELRGINTLLKFDPSNTILLNQKTNLLSDSVRETENRLKALKQAQQQLDGNNVDKNTSEYRNLQREIEVTTRKLTDLKNETSSFTRVGNKLEDFGNKVNSVGKNINNVGNKLTTGLTLPIVALGTYATKSAIDFETAFAGVKKTVDATESEYKELSQSIVDMSKKLPATTTEISAVAEAAGQLGIQKDSLISFTKTMIDLGESTNLSANDAATQLARFANITQMSQKDFDKLGSTVVALGNNFATTESEIVSMGLRLAGAGKQVGMSEAQIMSFATALSSVGIEAEMGGSAFSKVMLKIESDIAKNSNKLNDWAKVAGMNVSEFKRLWEQDAASALSKFVQGLGNLDKNGGNAVLTLENMELSEVRLRDTLLRAANANNVFSDALDLGTKSWQENVALTDEANKRYETTESQMAIAKNNINALAISLGKELLPHANNLLKYLNKLADKFANMSEEEQEALLKNLAFAASIGPISKGISSLASITSKTARGLGVFTRAIGLAKNGIGSATGLSAVLAKGITALASPIGVTITSLGLLATTLYAVSKIQTESEKNIERVTKKINEQTKSRKEMQNQVQKETESSLREVNNVESLVNELSKLADTNGKVKSGYEERVSFILNELNSAFGTEYKLVDGVIQKYDELVASIEEVLAKKRASIFLEGQEKEYKNAKQNIDSYTESVQKAKNSVKEVQKEYSRLLNEYNDTKGISAKGDIYMEARIDRKKQQLDKANKTLKEAEKNVTDSISTINSYETNMLRMNSDDLNEINKILTENNKLLDTNGKIKEKEFSKELSNQLTQTESIKQEYKKRIKDADDYTKQTLESNRRLSQQQLNDIISSLIGQTSAIEENSPAVKNAWKTLAKTSVEEYQATLAKLPADTRNAVIEMTGVAYDQSVGVGLAWANLAATSEEEFNNGIASLPEDTKAKIEQIAKSINDNGGQVTDKTKTLINQVLKELDKKDMSEVLGVNLTDGFTLGISNERTKKKLIEAAGSIGSAAIKALQHAIDSHSPSKKSRKLGQNYSSGFTLGILDKEKDAIKSAEHMSKKVLEATNISSSLEKMNGLDANINQKINDITRTIFTTPNIQFNVQKMDKQNLDLAFNYINKKFGSQY